jgi:hypothetical protein
MVISGLGCNIFAKVLIFWDSTKDYREKREIIWNYAPFCYLCKDFKTKMI